MTSTRELISDRELHARMSGELVALLSNVQWLIRRYRDGDVEMMPEVAVAAAAHLDSIADLMPAVDASAALHHPRRIPAPHIPVSLDHPVIPAALTDGGS